MTNSKWTDFSTQTKLHRSANVRLFLMVGGSLSIALGIIGIFVPILPTTPFLLLAAYCYARSSVRFYNWLLNNRFFGKYIQEWRRTGSISLKTKVIALIMLFLSMGSSILFFIPYFWMKLLVALIGIAVAAYLIRIPTS